MAGGGQVLAGVCLVVSADFWEITEITRRLSWHLRGRDSAPSTNQIFKYGLHLESANTALFPRPELLNAYMWCVYSPCVRINKWCLVRHRACKEIWKMEVATWLRSWPSLKVWTVSLSQRQIVLNIHSYKDNVINSLRHQLNCFL